MIAQGATLRIIAGDHRGRHIAVPPVGTRPMADRVRESLFAVLEPRIVGARFADLCAGSGAVGIEALSRGAVHALFVERSRDAVAIIQANLTTLKLTDRATLQGADVLVALTASGTTFDLIVADPLRRRRVSGGDPGALRCAWWPARRRAPCAHGAHATGWPTPSAP